MRIQCKQTWSNQVSILKQFDCYDSFILRKGRKQHKLYEKSNITNVFDFLKLKNNLNRYMDNALRKYEFLWGGGR